MVPANPGRSFIHPSATWWMRTLQAYTVSQTEQACELAAGCNLVHNTDLATGSPDAQPI